MTKPAFKDPVRAGWEGSNGERRPFPERLDNTAAERAGTAEGARKARRGRGVHPFKAGAR